MLPLPVNNWEYRHVHCCCRLMYPFDLDMIKVADGVGLLQAALDLSCL